jgi:hypothetical protein
MFLNKIGIIIVIFILSLFYFHFTQCTIRNIKSVDNSEIIQQYIQQIYVNETFCGTTFTEKWFSFYSADQRLTIEFPQGYETYDLYLLRDNYYPDYYCDNYNCIFVLDDTTGTGYYSARGERLYIYIQNVQGFSRNYCFTIKSRPYQSLGIVSVYVIVPVAVIIAVVVAICICGCVMHKRKHSGNNNSTGGSVTAVTTTNVHNSSPQPPTPQYHAQQPYYSPPPQPLPPQQQYQQQPPPPYY